ncbi:putative receptor protein kinase ZmPK1 [Tasmannia lanceolata]|uniref:putative receptor protein kinase ZmPK1 n=1 Tax=Tasmannia lanceolata TaxID=3420 RepID=UPI00406409A9
MVLSQHPVPIASSARIMNCPKPFGNTFFLLFTISFIIFHRSFSTTIQSLSPGSSLSVERYEDNLVSPDGTFSAGFRSVGENSYCFSIWFAKSANSTIVWMANRDQPVNGRLSTLSLQRDGNLVLTDAGRATVWETNTTSTSSIQLNLLNTGNLVLQTSVYGALWQSFDFPTDTLLPDQHLTRNTRLVSSRSLGNYSSGFYSLYFDNDNVLRLLYDGPSISSVYWPDPGLVTWVAGRTTYDDSRIAAFNLWGYFNSSDALQFFAADFGKGPRRRLTMDYDGNVRLYSLNNKGSWDTSWQAIGISCTIHGICGPYGMCRYATEKRCFCPPGFKEKDPSDSSQGCVPSFNLSCDPLESDFISIPNVDFYGYDFNYTEGLTLEQCKNICLELCSCKAFLYHLDGIGRCYPKTLLLNGYQSPSFSGTMHLRVPKNGAISNSNALREVKLNCSTEAHVELVRNYDKNQENSSVKYVLWFVIAIGGVELVCILTGWWYLYKKDNNSVILDQGYHLAATTGIKHFSYRELKKATSKFKEEIGRGGGGVVYKGVLSDKRVVAVKRLEGVNQGEAEFFAELSTIGRINHMNLIQMWGFCAEGKHRLLVSEYMEHGSLAENFSPSLTWEKRFEIATGTAKGLAYLHEECLEWVLHCDVKPQNILLDANYQPKVSDFGLSKQRDRRSVDDSNFSRIRGTRGYMAPEWITNLQITSKVDVYSYGIVVIEMVTGQSPIGFHVASGGSESEYEKLVPWVREKMSATPLNIKEIMDPSVDSPYDPSKMEVLIKVALKCVEEEKDSRPTMSQVVEMLLRHENDY